MSLEEIIKESVHFKFTDLKIDNPDDEKTIGRVEQLRPKMMLRIAFTAEISRNRTIMATMKVKLGEEMTITRLGLPDLSSAKMHPIENIAQYMPEAIGFGDEIVETLNRALKQNRPTKLENEKSSKKKSQRE